MKGRILMADYIGKYRTNYFHVTDEARYQELCKGLHDCDKPTQLNGPASQDPHVQWRLTNPRSDDHRIWYKDTDGNLKLYVEGEIDLDSILTVYDEKGNIIYTRTDGKDDRILHCIIGHGSLDWSGENLEDEDADLDSDFDTFLKELQKILPDDEVFVYQEIGHEKHRYLVGYGLVVSKTDVKSLSIDDWCTETAREMVGNSKYDPKTDY